MATKEENIARFEELLTECGKENIDTLITGLLRKTDFYNAPASQMNYKAYDGGLIEHLLNVYDILMEKANTEGTVLFDALQEGKVTDTNIVVVALLHDIYKMEHFEAYVKNQKVYDYETVELAREAGERVGNDQEGDYVWQAVTCYKVNEQFPLSSSNKTFALLNKFIKLDWGEYAAIACAGGPNKEDNLGFDTFYKAVKKYPLALALYEAKLEAMLLK